MPASPQAVLERLNNAVRRLDFDGCMACCTEDTEWNLRDGKMAELRAFVLAA